MRHVILHGHIFKNAGTTLDWSLQRYFGARFLDHRDEHAMRSDGEAHLKALLVSQPELQAVSSHHMPRSPAGLADTRFHRVYLLRHPLLRIESAYDFERKQTASTPGSLAAKAKSLAGYVEWRMQPGVSRTIRNYQTVYLAGMMGHTSNAILADNGFGDAIRTIQQVLTIGLVERYDESMVLLEEALSPFFGKLDLSYLPQNVGKQSGDSEEEKVSAVLGKLGDLQKRVIDENCYDLALYQLVSQRFDAQIGEISDFTGKLSEFRSRCADL